MTNPHNFYCPKCQNVVEIPYATEISERTCPTKGCGAPAASLWPSKAMYDRHIVMTEKKEAECAARSMQEPQAVQLAVPLKTPEELAGGQKIDNAARPVELPAPTVEDDVEEDDKDADHEDEDKE